MRGRVWGDSWEEVERFGAAKHDWLKRFLALPNGIPSHDTFGRVIARLDPQAFGKCVAGWMAGAGSGPSRTAASAASGTPSSGS